MTELIIKSKIKSAVPELSVSGDVAEALNKKSSSALRRSIKKSKS